MALRVSGSFLGALLALLAAAGLQAQQPIPLPPLPGEPVSDNPLTSRQQKALREFIEQLFGPEKSAQPQPMEKVPDPPPTLPQFIPGGFGPAPPIAPPPPSGAVPMATPFVQPRFSFKISANAPLTELLPMAPKTPAKLPMWTNEDLAKVAEMSFAEPISKDLDKMKSMEAIAHTLANVNHLNRKKSDGFMLALLEQRGDLRGLPVLMGDECRTREEQARTFKEVADIVNQALAQCKRNPNVNDQRPVPAPSAPFSTTRDNDQLWNTMSNINGIVQRDALKNAGFAITTYNKELVNRAMVAALMQILMPEAESYRLGLAKFLATVPHPDATKALARLALFSPEEDVRRAAIEGLKPRREKDYTDILLQGFRYPLPAVSKRAAEALVKLERKDVLENLVRVLESPDPRLPVSVKKDGKEVTFVRELVKVNHHRNCILCHAPGNTEGMPEGVLAVPVPLPGEPLPRPVQGGYSGTVPPSPDILVRIDMTYLRQDFSVMLPVANPEPWPELQRFDFLVRTRSLRASEAQAYDDCCEVEEPGRVSPYHRAALFALRELTGRDTEPTAAAWRKLLKLPKAGVLAY